MDACVDIIARHPFIGPRYGTLLGDLGPVWLSLLGCEAFRAYVYEDLQGSSPRLIGIGCSAIITDAFLQEAKTPPFFWIGAELTRRIHRGQSPLLSDKQVREANSNLGVNVTVWDGAVSVSDMHRDEVSFSFLSTFIQLHRGFLLKEIVGQGSTEDTLAAVLRAGYSGSVRSNRKHIFARELSRAARSSSNSWLRSGYARSLPLLSGISPSSSSFDAKEVDIFESKQKLSLAARYTIPWFQLLSESSLDTRSSALRSRAAKWMAIWWISLNVPTNGSSILPIFLGTASLPVC